MHATRATLIAFLSITDMYMYMHTLAQIQSSLLLALLPVLASGGQLQCLTWRTKDLSLRSSSVVKGKSGTLQNVAM